MRGRRGQRGGRCGQGMSRIREVETFRVFTSIHGNCITVVLLKSMYTTAWKAVLKDFSAGS